MLGTNPLEVFHSAMHLSCHVMQLEGNTRPKEKASECVVCCLVTILIKIKDLKCLCAPYILSNVCTPIPNLHFQKRARKHWHSLSLNVTHTHMSQNEMDNSNQHINSQTYPNMCLYKPSYISCVLGFSRFLLLISLQTSKPMHVDISILNIKVTRFASCLGSRVI